MKKRSLIIAISALIFAGAIGGAGVAIAATVGKSLDDRVAEELGVSPTDFQAAVEQATAQAVEEQISRAVTRLVDGGGFTAEQGEEFRAWISSEPQITINFSYTNRLFGSLPTLMGSGPFGGDGVASILGVTSGELNDAVDNVLDGLFLDESLLGTPKQMLTFLFNQAALFSSSSLGIAVSLSDEDIAAFQSWIDSMPDWLNDFEVFTQVMGAYILPAYADFGYGYGYDDYGELTDQECIYPQTIEIEEKCAAEAEAFTAPLPVPVPTPVPVHPDDIPDQDS